MFSNRVSSVFFSSVFALLLGACLLLPKNGFAAMSADVNCDNNVNIQDAVAIVGVILGLIELEDCEPPEICDITIDNEASFNEGYSAGESSVECEGCALDVIVLPGFVDMGSQDCMMALDMAGITWWELEQQTWALINQYQCAFTAQLQCNMDVQNFLCYGTLINGGDDHFLTSGLYRTTGGASGTCSGAGTEPELDDHFGLSPGGVYCDLSQGTWTCDNAAGCTGAEVDMTCTNGSECENGSPVGSNPAIMNCESSSTCTGWASTGFAQTFMNCAAGTTCSCHASTGSAKCIMNCEEGADCSCSTSTGSSQCIWN